MHVLLLVFFFYSSVVMLNQFQVYGKEVSYELAWPGMLPDHPLYKVKVLRNKIIERMIISPVKKVEFDLLMADKTIYASKLLIDKGEISLAKETVLKGENYYSQLVQHYNKALLQGEKIPQDLDRRIMVAVKKHQEVFKESKKNLNNEDRKSFEAAENFSYINATFIEGLRTQEKNN